jgi:hypothetical protein
MGIPGSKNAADKCLCRKLTPIVSWYLNGIPTSVRYVE